MLERWQDNKFSTQNKLKDEHYKTNGHKATAALPAHSQEENEGHLSK